VSERIFCKREIKNGLVPEGAGDRWRIAASGLGLQESAA
jgi:hypothetical protein